MRLRITMITTHSQYSLLSAARPVICGLGLPDFHILPFSPPWRGVKPREKYHIMHPTRGKVGHGITACEDQDIQHTMREKTYPDLIRELDCWTAT